MKNTNKTHRSQGIPYIIYVENMLKHYISFIKQYQILVVKITVKIQYNLHVDASCVENLNADAEGKKKAQVSAQLGWLFICDW